MAAVRDVFHGLLADHDSIEREVRNVDGGVATTTTSEDPEIVARIQTHVRQMQERLRTGEGLRHWDPLFVEIFRHHDTIEMQLEDLPNGIRVTETSTDPQVVGLIREHAKTVSEFVARGFDRAHEASPLPEGYAVQTAADPTTTGDGKRGGCGRGCCGGRAAATK